MKFPWTTSIVDVLKDDNKLDEKLQHIVKSLLKQKEDISKVVEELGPALTAKETETRLKGIKFLTDILKSLPAELLDDKQLGFISTFYCDRMKDHHSIAPHVITGLLAIIKMKNLPRTSAVTILQQLFANIPCQSQVRGDRANIFSIIQHLADNYQPELEAMGADFVYGVIGAIEAERDPRNLVFLYEYMPKFIATYPLRHLSEEMFESFSCYFPIDFHPSPNDPQAITRDVLAEKLAVCLCAAKEFAEPCITLALEKLDSDLKVAKLDSMNLLIEGTKHFDGTTILEHFDDIWLALKGEILPGANKEVLAKALRTIRAIIIMLKDDAANQEIVLNKIFTIVIGTLLNRDSNLYRSTFNLVLTCADATDRSCLYVVGKVLPITLTELTGNEELSDHDQAEVLEDFHKVLLVLKQNNLMSHFSNDNSMLHVQKELMKVLLIPSVSQEAINAVVRVLTVMASIVSDDNRQIVYKKLSANLTSASQQEMECLLSFAQCFPNEVNTFVLDPFMGKTYSDVTIAKSLFPTLARLLVVPDIRDHVIEFLCLNVFNNKNAAIQLIVLQVIHDILSSLKSHEEIARILHVEWRIVVKLIDLIKNENVEEGDEVMYQASLLMSFIVRTLPSDQQTELIEKYLPLMRLNESISDLYVVSGLLGFLDAAIPLDAHFDQLVRELTKLSLEGTDETSRKLANQLLCSLFNRAPIDDRHRKILRKLLDVIKDELKKHNHQAVELLAWLSKGLLARGHPDAAELMETLSELLDHPKLSKAAELAFEIISLELPQLHLPLLKHLFKQKIFVLAMKFLESKVEKFSEHHLTAMAHVLQITPHQVLKMNIEKVGPILFKCLANGSDGDVHPHSKRTFLSLKIINHFIEDKSEYMQLHLQHLVKDLLELTKFKASMEVRITALKCLESATTSYPLFTLVPYKEDVTRELETALDDPKRLVRAAAVQARMAWFMMGEPEQTPAAK